jgi:hypothetical protein
VELGHLWLAGNPVVLSHARVTVAHASSIHHLTDISDTIAL